MYQLTRRFVVQFIFRLLNELFEYSHSVKFGFFYWFKVKIGLESQILYLHSILLNKITYYCCERNKCVRQIWHARAAGTFIDYLLWHSHR